MPVVGEVKDEDEQCKRVGLVLVQSGSDDRIRKRETRTQ